MTVESAYACPVDGYGFPTCMGDGSACSPDRTRCSGAAPVPSTGTQHDISVTTRRHPNGWMSGLAVASCRCGWSRIVCYLHPEKVAPALAEVSTEANDHLANPGKS